MQVRFLLGPAGSGKTFRCLAEIRAALVAPSRPFDEKQERSGETPVPLEPSEAALVLIAPKQATFQLERQLLDGGAISGFTRLHVLSFDRLAQFIFDNLHSAPPSLLSAEGRLMVLRSLLRQHDGDLKLLGGSARRAGFAQELGGQLAELQQHQYGPARLRALAANENLRGELRFKLHDLALLLEQYTGWLKDHDLQDANQLLDFATDRLRAETAAGHSSFAIQHLWLDGFAEMTPQEHALLAAVMPFCQGATLAFCLETEPTPPASWLSIWSAIGKTFQRCRDQLAVVPGCEVRTEVLPRVAEKSRFVKNSALAALEEGWALPVAAEFVSLDLNDHISVAACANPEAEAVFAARELLRFVRQDRRNRFRDCAVLVRNLENYHRLLARIFRRYEIPFFLDRRESVAHHPLAELTRSALRTIAGDWRPDDWFAALKAGFSPLPETDLDRLENAALEFGWRGKKWREPLPDEDCERFRQRVMPPFEKLYHRLQRQRFEPTGAQLADAIAELWALLDVRSALEQWSLAETGAPAGVPRHSSVHQTVFEQMNAWLENVAIAFPRETMPLADWLPVLEAGLASLTVGVIPPALDEVLVGAIDRARNPDLKFTLLLGVNESVFPAAPAAPVILTTSDRNELDRQNASLGLDLLNQISRERYLGYIACTRASQRLAVTFSRQDAAGRTLNPSPFVGHLQTTFPQLEIQEFSGEPDWRQAEHVGELIGEIVRIGNPLSGDDIVAQTSKSAVSQVSNLRARIVREPYEQSRPADLEIGDTAGLETCATGGVPGESPSSLSRLLEIPALKSLAEKLAQLREPDEMENLSPVLAERIYGPVLKSSVSKLEEFAQCPIRFFIHAGLRAEERKKFELDARERGSFQHEVLKKFHDDLVAENKRWRDITPPEARERIRQTAESVAAAYHEGLFRINEQSRFMARALTTSLQDFVETLVFWMRGQYDFDPAMAEIGFGLDDPGQPAWKIELGCGHALALRGRVDRIDLFRQGGQSLAVVMDYKSSSKRLDKLLIEHGIQLQLLAYLAVVRRWPAEFFGTEKIVPAGVFYVNLRGQFENGSSRTEVLAKAETAKRLAYRHTGRFDAAVLGKLDRSLAGDQFSYRLNKDGALRSNSTEALEGKEFTGLLDQVEEQLRRLGQRIYSGAAEVDPYRKGAATACEYCDYRAVCRIDEWSHEYRELRATEKLPSPTQS